MAFTQGGVTYTVTPEVVHNAGSSCLSKASEIQSQLAHLRTFVVSLEDDWKGVASNQFQTLMHEYDTDANLLHEALTAIGNALNPTANNYADADHTSSTNLAGIHLPTAKLG